METIFDIRKPSMNNRSSFFTRFLELELSKYFNEFEIMTEVYGEKSVNIDCQRYVLRLTDSVKIFNILISMMKRCLDYQLKGYNSS